MPQWTPEELVAVARMTVREFEAAYPGRHSPSAIHIRRRKLRDVGIEVKRADLGRPPDPLAVTLPETPPDASDEELWAAYDAMHAVTRQHGESQALPEADVAIETDRPVGIVFMSDFHLGNAGTDTQRLREDVALINTCDRLRVYVGGDGIDNFIIPALASAHRDGSLVTLEMQYLLFRSVIRRLMPNLLAVGTGNHDAWTKKMAGIEAMLYALRDIPVLHTREDTYLNLRVGNQQYTIFRKHRPPRSTQLNEGHGVQHQFRFGERPFDVGVMEHHHVPHISTFFGHGQLRWAIRTGSYKVRDSFAREFGFYNGQPGTPVIVLFPYRKTIVPFMNIADAIEFLEAG
jgi:hypothetical protein